MKKLFCQMGMITCALGIMMVLGGWLEGTVSMLAAILSVGLLLLVQKGLSQLAVRRIFRRRARAEVQLCARKSNLRAA